MHCEVVGHPPAPLHEMNKSSVTVSFCQRSDINSVPERISSFVGVGGRDWKGTVVNFLFQSVSHSSFFFSLSVFLVVCWHSSAKPLRFAQCCVRE